LRAAAALAATIAATTVGVGVAGGRSAIACTPRAPIGYTRSIERVLADGSDVRGRRAVSAPNGPSYSSVATRLPPLLYAVGANGRKVTASGVYYLAFSMPFSPYGPRSFELHVADGSEIVSRRIGGPHLTVIVGSTGRERFGSCLARAGRSRLADGYLPILEASYTDAGGVGYREESFAGRASGTRSLVSFVHLVVDARAATPGALVRLVSSEGPARVVTVPPGTRLDVYAAWSGADGFVPVDADSYAGARRRTVAFWSRQLARASLFDVPERRVDDAERALLIQELSMTWRYSIGNTYEELSFAEALDVAEVMAEYGYGDIAKAILRFTLRRLPARFSGRRAGERLVAGAVYYRLVHDRAYVREETPELASAVTRLGREIERPGGIGLVDREAVSTDVGTKIYGLHAQTAVWEGLLAMGRVWDQTGQRALALRCRTLAHRLALALRTAIRRSERRLPDGSLFLPLALLDPVHPYVPITATRDGSYWNLLIPYALASGFVTPHGAEARGVLRYLSLHGSRLLGLVRSADEKLYRHRVYPLSGTDEVYGLSVSRFLADNDEPDQLALSLYGMLAASMAPDTFVSGEGATVFPLHGELDRTMLLPPNSGAAATFLETLRLLLVHETRGPDGSPTGLELAFATPRSWLDDGRTITVRGAPTSFGPVSYTLRRDGETVRAALTVPAAPAVRLRLRLPAGERITVVRLEGRLVPYDARTDTIDLSGRHGHLALVATLAG
jgi:hypothetical protein